MKKSQNVGTKSAFTPVEYYYDPSYLFFIIKNLRIIYSSTFSGLTTIVVIFFFFFKKKNNCSYIQASEHALMRMLKGSSIVWIRVNLEHLL